MTFRPDELLALPDAELARIVNAKPVEPKTFNLDVLFDGLDEAIVMAEQLDRIRALLSEKRVTMWRADVASISAAELWAIVGDAE